MLLTWQQVASEAEMQQLCASCDMVQLLLRWSIEQGQMLMWRNGYLSCYNMVHCLSVFLMLKQ